MNHIIDIQGRKTNMVSSDINRRVEFNLIVTCKAVCNVKMLALQSKKVCMLELIVFSFNVVLNISFSFQLMVL